MGGRLRPANPRPSMAVPSIVLAGERMIFMDWGRIKRTRAIQEPSPGSEAEPISPELVLVDPSLRHVLFSGESNGTSSLVPTFPATADAVTEPFLAKDPESSDSAPRRTWQGLLVAALLGSLATIGVGLVLWALPLGSSDERSASTTAAGESIPTTGSQPAPESTANADEAQAANGQGAAATPTRPAGQQGAQTQAAPAPRRFAWAPVAGATAYDVAIYKDDVPVFRARTKTPSIVIPERSRQAGAERLLEPGTYQWYVWPVRNGQPDRVALVRSTLVVPAALDCRASELAVRLRVGLSPRRISPGALELSLRAPVDAAIRGSFAG